MIRIVIGSVAAAFAMFFVAALFFATPLSRLGYSAVDDTQSAAVQVALAQNLSVTGTYAIPNTSTRTGAILYSNGPIATISYNIRGFAPNSATVMLKGLIHYFIVALLMGAALLGIATRVTDFDSRMRVLVPIIVAVIGYTSFAGPIWFHHGLLFATFDFVADVATLTAGGFVLIRWFLPRDHAL